jgi:transcriptional regulator with XRE-family HTH domain
MEQKLNIKQLMATAKVTQQQLADRLGVKQSTIAGMLNPKGDPRLSTLRKISRELGISLETLAATYHDRMGDPDRDVGGEDNN